jgi:peptidylprolyl isomerase
VSTTAKGNQPMTKAQRRAAAKAAAIRRRRLRALAGAFAGVAVVVGLIVALVLSARSDGDEEAAAPAASSPAAPSPGGQSPAGEDPAFPPLPAGADPALGTKPTVGKGSGALSKLTVKPLIRGTGPAVAAGQTVTVNYVGVSYRTGEEFDASWNRGDTIEFPLGAGRVIPGWDQGLVGVTVGSRVQLDIPSALAYGDNPEGGRPAGPLRFVVDVLAAQ